MDRDTQVEMRQEDKNRQDGDTHIQTRQKGKNREKETDKTERQKWKERDSGTPVIIETRQKSINERDTHIKTDKTEKQEQRHPHRQGRNARTTRQRDKWREKSEKLSLTHIEARQRGKNREK